MPSLNIHPIENHYLQRVAVIGTSCSGKTTFASQLAAILQVDHIELDALYWLPNWVQRPRDDFRNLTRAAVSAEQWVLDGNYSSVRDIVWVRATALIWLNYSFPVIAYRAIRRTTHRVISRQVLYSDNRETFRTTFLSRDSILWWIVQTYRRRRREYPRIFQEPTYQHLQVVVLSRPQDAARFLHDVAAHTTAPHHGPTLS